MTQPRGLELAPDPHKSPWSEPTTPSFSHDFSAPSMQNDGHITGKIDQGAGKRPALSFGFSTPERISSTSAQNTSEPASFGFGTPSVLGGSTSFSGPSSFGRNPSFASYSFCSSKPAASRLLPSQAPVTSSPQHPELKGDDLLSKAVHRATRHRKAVIGIQDVAADKLIANYLNTTNGGPGIQNLASDLTLVAQTNPTAMAFLRHIFKQASSAEAPPPPRLTYQITRRSQAESELKHLLNEKFREFEWGEDLCDYIMRMIIFGASPREIRVAVKAYAEHMHGRNNVSAKEVEGLVEWIRGDVVDLVEEVRFTGTALDYFRPSVRYDKRTLKLAKGDEVAGSGEFVKDEPVCACNESRKKHDERSAKDDGAKEAIDEANKLTKENATKAFPLMDLPAEMRMWVYKAALTPTGHISLRTCAHHIPSGVHPPIASAIYAVSKSLRKEAEGLLFDNTIIVNSCLESGIRPAIHRNRLPEHILPLIKSLVLVLDFTRIISSGARDADFRVAQGMTGLEKLRICGIATTDLGNHLSSHLATYLRVVMERVPASCEVVFGEEEAGREVREHIEDMVGKIQVTSGIQGGPSLRLACAMGGMRLESVWAGIESEVDRGCKPGAKEDFRFEERRAKGELDEHFRLARGRQVE